MKNLTSYPTHTLLKWNVLIPQMLKVNSSGRRPYRAVLYVMAAVLLLVNVSQLHTQQVTAILVGTVTDAQGSVVPGAQVEATNVATGVVRSGVSNEVGDYRIEYVPVGDYTMVVTAAGFKKSVQNNVHLTVDRTQRVDFSLAVGEVDQTVTVSTAPPAINTSTAEIGHTIESDQILGLPLVNRNIYSQLSLIPGVQGNSGTAASGATALGLGLPYQSTQINGGIDAYSASVSYFLDGGLNMTGLRNYGSVMPNPEAISEFRVQTNNYDAEYGRMSSGVISVVTRSGTNKFHGSANEFYRDKVLNATNWNSGGVLVPYHRNQFAGTVGGPIIKDKTFFFVSYGGIQQKTGQFISGAVVLTDPERTGDFSHSNIAPIDPTTGVAFPGGIIPASRQDPTALNIINTYLPHAQAGVSTNAAGLNNGWKGSILLPFSQNEVLGKIDHELSSTQHLTVSYFFVKTNNTVFPGGNIAPYSHSLQFASQHNINISHVKSFSSRLSNQVWLTYLRDLGGRQNLPSTSLGDLSQSSTTPEICPNGCHPFTIQGAPNLPNIGVSGYFTLGQGIMGPEAGTNLYSARDAVTYTRGRHAVAFGGEISLNKDMQLTDLENYGSFSFATSAPHSTKNAAADFLTGNVNNFEQDTPDEALDNSWYYAVFFQDNYRVTPRLTLNLGLRYDLQTPLTDPQDKELTWVPGRQSVVIPQALPGLLFPGDPGVTRGTVSLRKHHIAPRVGVAYDPFGDGKTSIRAAAGIFYGSVAGNEWNATSNFEPFAIRQTFNTVSSLSDVYGKTDYYGNQTSFYATGDPFPIIYNPKTAAFPILPANIEGAQLNFQWPLTYQLNTSVQHEFRSDLSVTVSYVGSLAHDLPFQWDENYPAWAPGASTSAANLQSRRPYGATNVGLATMLTSSQTASYHAIELVAHKTMSKNFTVNGFYVLSHTFWSAPPSTAGSSTIQDYDNLKAERGPADYDVRHRATISGIWNIGYYNGSNGAIKQLLNGWTISPIYAVSSGGPFSVSTGSDNNKDGYATDRPDMVSGVSPFLNPHRSRQQAAAAWFNTAAFVANGPGVTGGIGPGGADGNEPRDLMRYPGYHDVDLGIFRTFTIEGYSLELRGEATNVLNLVNLGGPNASLSSGSNFGKITGAGQQRTMQIGARLTF